MIGPFVPAPAPPTPPPAPARPSLPVPSQSHSPTPPRARHAAVPARRSSHVHDTVLPWMHGSRNGLVSNEQLPSAHASASPATLRLTMPRDVEITRTRIPRVHKRVQPCKRPAQPVPATDEKLPVHRASCLFRSACAASTLLAACAGRVGFEPAPRGEHVGTAAPDAGNPLVEIVPTASAPSLGPVTRVMTWNVEWFGDPERGPEDAAQAEGVRDVLERFPTDLLALQEISNEAAHAALLAHFDVFEAVLAEGHASQRLALWVRRDRFELVAAEEIDGLDDAGRPPLHVTLRDRADGAELHAVVVHAKAGLDPASAAQRARFAQGLVDALSVDPGAAPMVVLGDFNDEIERSLADGGPSPYAAWLERGWQAPTRILEHPEAEHSTAWGAQLDHILVNDALAPSLWPASVDVLRDELLADMPDLPNRVSDHFPVRLRLSAPSGAR